MTRYLQRPVETWRLVVRAGQSLTTPRIDPECDDAAVDELAAGSLFGRAARSVSSTLTRSWRSSMLRRAAAAGAADLAPLDRSARVRSAGVCVLVAAVVVLAGRFAQASAGRFTWALPAVAAVVGWLMMAVSGPIAQALEDRRR
jgi:hypothetical protein